jgi:aminoglycoside phosphotransferase (APT) family kinase protein
MSVISGGTQNVMVRFVREGRSYVLRRGPVHLRSTSNKSILRETRALGALAGTAVPHPELIAVCADTSVLDGAAFFLMERVEGFNAGLELPEPHALDADMRRDMGLCLVDSLAALGGVDHVGAGLADFGKPDGFIERQVPRWLAELESYRELDGYPAEALPGLESVAAWLREHQPANWTPGIMHGDFHCANAMFSRTGPKVAAIVDWEMATIGDPLLDLGWLLATWRLPEAPSIFGGDFMRSGGLATEQELIARYARNSTRDLTALRWYTVLACFKLGILLEGTWARACAGKAPRETGLALHETTLLLFQRAHTMMDGDQ